MERENEIPLWINEDREKDTHPQLKAGSPVVVGGQEYWANAWVNIGSSDDATDEDREQLAKIMTWLAGKNGKRPIIKVSLKPAEAKKGPAPAAGPAPNLDSPF